MFADDATIYEPFSKIHGGLQGKTAIKVFLEVVLMADDGLQHDIQFEKQDEKPGSKEYNNNRYNDNQITALVTFTRGGKLKAKFTFGLSEENYNSQMLKKIQSMHIESQYRKRLLVKLDHGLDLVLHCNTLYPTNYYNKIKSICMHIYKKCVQSITVPYLFANQMG